MKQRWINPFNQGALATKNLRNLRNLLNLLNLREIFFYQSGIKKDSSGIPQHESVTVGYRLRSPTRGLYLRDEGGEGGGED